MLTRARLRSRGVTLIEILVAIVVVSVGVLGIAKMQALAIASTRTSSVRSLVAVEAASMASAIHANRAYWQSVTLPFSATVTVTKTGSTLSSTIASSDNNMAGMSASCVTAVCSAPQMAAFDLNQWALALWGLSPSLTSTAPSVSCSASLAISGTPVAVCTVQIQWTETTVGMNGAYAANAAPTLSYDLVVEP
jgi:type IV pilus assembly protein PilV